MPEAFTIQGFASKGSKPNPHGGVLHKWEVSLDDEQGQTHHGVYWQSKSDELHIGQEVYGEISDGDYGPRFRTAQREDSAPRPSQSVSGGRSGGSAKEDYWDAKDRRIEWAWACNLAATELKQTGPLEHGDVVERARQIREQAREELDADVGGEAGSVTPGVPAADVSAAGDKLTAEEQAMTPAQLASAPPVWEEASTAQKRRLTQEFNRLQLAREAQKAIVLYRCRSEKATKDGASQLIKDITEGATAESLLAEISDGRRAGNPLAARAAALIPTDVPNAEPPEEPVPANGDEIPF